MPLFKDFGSNCGERAMGEALRVEFERRLKLEFHGSKVTSDAGLLTYRELDEALGLTVMAEGKPKPTGTPSVCQARTCWSVRLGLF
jgi:hypothetical protein